MTKRASIALWLGFKLFLHVLGYKQNEMNRPSSCVCKSKGIAIGGHKAFRSRGKELDMHSLSTFSLARCNGSVQTRISPYGKTLESLLTILFHRTTASAFQD